MVELTLDKFKFSNTKNKMTNIDKALQIATSDDHSYEAWQKLLAILEDATDDEERECLRTINGGWITSGGQTVDYEEIARLLGEDIEVILREDNI
jgi:hypothetical protein